VEKEIKLKHAKSEEEIIDRLNCSIHDILKYINTSIIYKSVDACFAKRLKSGERSILGVVRNARVNSCELVKTNSMILHSTYGLASFDIYLSDLSYVEIYDGYGEFRSNSSIDFLYSVNGAMKFSILSKTEMLPKHMPLWQWQHVDERLEHRLDNLGKHIVYLYEEEDGYDLDLR